MYKVDGFVLPTDTDKCKEQAACPGPDMAAVYFEHTDTHNVL